ncbi:MAG TPA: hypothetical protein VGB14_14190 [Acidimicrobiales bacterium]
MERRTPPRRLLPLLVVPLVALVIASNVGDALAPTLVNEHPVWLMALNARNRNLVLVVNNVEPLVYFVVGTVRLLVSDPLFYLLGFFYGDAAVKWAERRAPSVGEVLRWIEKAFSKAAWPLVFLAPNNYICLFAGSAGMTPAVFLVLNVTGTIARLWLIKITGEAFEAPLTDLLGFIRDYQWPLTALAFAMVAGSWVLQRLRGKDEIGALVRLEEELDQEEDLLASGVGTGEAPVDLERDELAQAALAVAVPSEDDEEDEADQAPG